MRRAKDSAGFTLIELMVVVAIIGILTTIAYPSYQNSVRKTNRAEAKTELADAAQRFQRCYTATGKFNDASCTVYTATSGGSSLTTRGSGFYTIKLATAPAVSATTFMLVATAVKTPQKEDTANGCNILSLDQNGNKLPAACW